MITEFFINKLYGEQDVKITFDSNYKIIVAENGTGKTTILNSFYSLVSGNISKLEKVEFESIGLTFDNETTIKFEKSEFDGNLKFIKSYSPYSPYSLLEKRLDKDVIISLIDLVEKQPNYLIEKNHSFREVLKTIDMPPSVLIDYLLEIRHHRRYKKISKATQEKLDKIKKHFPFEPLYLPTYRRVEEDFRNFYSQKDRTPQKFSSINFGMGDVAASITEITSEILVSSVEWFSKINGQMLTQLVDGFSITEDMYKSISNPKAVQIVLERIGKNISDSHKEQILSLVKSGDIRKGRHDALIYFVSNLLKVYEQQQENDKVIQQFTTVSNKYLNDKEVVYNESNVTIDIIRKKNSHSVAIESLSSGEKQIISLFALLYLQKMTDVAIFFDEPELSLSMEWQKTLLPDIISSGKCKFLFATTHSPFIFENDLVSNTADLTAYIKEL